MRQPLIIEAVAAGLLQNRLPEDIVLKQAVTDNDSPHKREIVPSSFVLLCAKSDASGTTLAEEKSSDTNILCRLITVDSEAKYGI